MPTVTIIGGTGFIGTHLTERLSRLGYRVRVVARRAAATAPHGGPLFERGSITDAEFVARCVRDSWAVVNLVGTTSARDARAFNRLHHEAPRALAEAAASHGLERLVHVSAMGADAGAPSLADRSKVAGEDAVTAAFPPANIVRPALVYGRGDHFLTRLARLLARSPAIPLIGGGRTLFQPIHVDDFVSAVSAMLGDPRTRGHSYDLGAGDVLTLRELVELVRAIVRPNQLRRPPLVSVPFPLAKALAALAERLPDPSLTVDQVRLLETDKVSRGRPGPSALGIYAGGRHRLVEDIRQRFAR